MALDAISLGVLMPLGHDSMIEPPLDSVASHARQPNYFRRRHASPYTPTSLISSLALESAPNHFIDIPNSCITGTRISPDSYVVCSTAGPCRDTVMTSTLPTATLNSSLPNNNNSNNNNTYSPWYTKARGPIHQLLLNYKCPPGWDRCLHLPSDPPILAVRSSHCVQFWQLHLDNALEPGNNNRWILDENKNRAIKRVDTVAETADVAWCRHITQRCAIITSDAFLLDVPSLEYCSNTSTTMSSDRSMRRIRLPVEPRPPGGHLHQFVSPTNNNYNNSIHPIPTLFKCQFLYSHPRCCAVSAHTSLGIIDLNSSMHSTTTHRYASTPTLSSSYQVHMYTCLPGQWISTIQVPDGNSPGQSNTPNYIAAATPTDILLFDIRRPQAIVARWEHGMASNSSAFKFSSSSSNNALGAHVMYYKKCAPDSLHFLSSPGKASPSSTASHSFKILASNSWTGRAVVCEWKETVRQGRVGAVFHGGVDATMTDAVRDQDDNGGEYGDGEDEIEVREVPVEDIEVDRREGFRRSRCTFAFQPAGWTKLHCNLDTPPRLVCDVSRGYPPALTRAIRNTRFDNDNYSPDKNGVAVAFLPRSDLDDFVPVFLGMTVLNTNENRNNSCGGNYREEEEREEEREEEFVLAALLPTQPIILIRLVQQQKDEQRHEQQNNYDDNNTKNDRGSSSPQEEDQIMILVQQQHDGARYAVRLDQTTGRRMIQDPQKALRNALIGNKTREEKKIRNDNKRMCGNFNTAPRDFMVKTSKFVGLFLHKWLLEQSIRQFNNKDGDGITPDRSHINKRNNGDRATNSSSYADAAALSVSRDEEGMGSSSLEVAVTGAEIFLFEGSRMQPVQGIPAGSSGNHETITTRYDDTITATLGRLFCLNNYNSNTVNSTHGLEQMDVMGKGKGKGRAIKTTTTATNVHRRKGAPRQSRNTSAAGIHILTALFMDALLYRAGFPQPPPSSLIQIVPASHQDDNIDNIRRAQLKGKGIKQAYGAENGRMLRNFREEYEAAGMNTVMPQQSNWYTLMPCRDMTRIPSVLSTFSTLSSDVYGRNEFEATKMKYIVRRHRAAPMVVDDVGDCGGGEVVLTAARPASIRSDEENARGGGGVLVLEKAMTHQLSVEATTALAALDEKWNEPHD